METRLRRAAAALGLALLLALAGCADGATDPTAPTTPNRSTAPPPSAPVALADLEESVEEIVTHRQIQQYWGAPIPGTQPGRFWCEGPDPVTAGSAVTCRWVDDCEDCAQATNVTQLVSVLDDTGRFTFATVDPSIGTLHPDHFAAGTTSCAVLAAPRPVDGGEQRLSYPALVHYWLSSGSPAAMDPDGNGQPCDADYPADLVAAVFDSPLAPAPTTATGLTMEGVRRHAQAVLIGVTRDTVLRDCGSTDPPAAGATMDCLRMPADGGPASADPHLYFSVLDDDGRYVVAAPDRDLMPTLEDYPPDSTCSDFATAPPPRPDGSVKWLSEVRLSYDQVYYKWLELGQPTSWDEDGDGRPCEDVYGAAHDYLVASPFQP